MNENVAGVTGLEKHVKMMVKAEKIQRPKVRIEIEAEWIKGMKNMCQGIHIMPLGWDKYVPDLLEKI